MKILWLCSTATPEIAEKMNLDSSVNVSWIVNVLDELKKCDHIKMGICFPVMGENLLTEKVNKVECFGFPQDKAKTTAYNKNLESCFEQIIKSFEPDVIHIWGTEYLHTLAMATVCERLGIINKAVISIQGLCSVIAGHYYAGLPHNIVNRYTIRDILKRENIKKQKKDFEIRGSYEVAALKKAKHVIGRTDWDKACVTQINPQIKYHFCNETLRDSFYNNKWDYEKCEKHSIFVSQGYYPVKGLHFILEALSILKKDYPDVKLHVGGIDMINRGWKTGSYGKYIKKLISKYELNGHVCFTGMLDEDKMCEQYLKANVFVSASSIENSSNSVGEAMILGMPVVSSDVGGIKNLITHNEEGYIYPYDEAYMLAYYIKQIFEKPEDAVKVGEKAKEKAMKTHERTENIKQLINIYKEVQEDAHE